MFLNKTLEGGKGVKESEGLAVSLPEAHTRRRGRPDCGHGDPGPRAESALRPARRASGLAVGRPASDSTQAGAAALSANGFLFAKPQAEEGVWELGDVRDVGVSGPLTLPPKLPHQSLLCPSSLSLFFF